MAQGIRFCHKILHVVLVSKHTVTRELHAKLLAPRPKLALYALGLLSWCAGYPYSLDERATM